MKRGMTEQIESDLARGNQAETPERERAVDRTRALAYASPLGRAIKHLHARLTAAHLARCVDELLTVIKRERIQARRMPAARVEAIARVAVVKSLQPACDHCNGRGWVATAYLSDPRATCATCLGTGRAQHSRDHIQRACGFHLYPEEWRLLAFAEDELARHDELAGAIVARMVGRPEDAGR